MMRARNFHFIAFTSFAVQLFLETTGSERSALKAVAVLPPGIGPVACVLAGKGPQAVLDLFFADTFATGAGCRAMLKRRSPQQTCPALGMKLLVTEIPVMPIASRGSIAVGVHVVGAIESARDTGESLEQSHAVFGPPAVAFAVEFKPPVPVRVIGQGLLAQPGPQQCQPMDSLPLDRDRSELFQAQGIDRVQRVVA